MNAAPDLGHSPIPAAHRGVCTCGLCMSRIDIARQRVRSGYYDSPAVIDKAVTGILADMLPGEPAPAYLAGALAATA